MLLVALLSFSHDCNARDHIKLVTTQTPLGALPRDGCVSWRRLIKQTNNLEPTLELESRKLEYDLTLTKPNRNRNRGELLLAKSNHDMKQHMSLSL